MTDTPPASGPALAPRVDQRRDHVDQRIEDEQDPCADGQGIRRRGKRGGPGNVREATDEEEPHVDAHCPID
jgi:hypothetical protein